VDIISSEIIADTFPGVIYLSYHRNAIAGSKGVILI
jgi:hypothetical protein